MRSSIARAVTLGLGLIFNVVVARALGPDAAGDFFAALVVATLLGMVGRLGSESYALRLVSAAPSGQPSAAPGAESIALARIAVIGSLAAGAFCASVLGLGATAARPASDLGLHLLILAASVPLASVALLNSAILRGLGRTVSGAFAELGLTQGLAAGLLAAASLGHTLSPAFASVAYVMAAGVTAAWSTWRLRRFWRARMNRPAPAGYVAVPWRELLHMMGTSVLFFGLTWVPIMALWLTSTSAAVAEYTAAFRYASVLLLVPTIQVTYTIPRIGHAYPRGDIQGVNSILRRVNRQAAVVAAVAAVFITLAAAPLLEVFGPEFRAAETTLRILVLAQVGIVLAGMVNPLMLILGLEKQAMALTLAALLASSAVALPAGLYRGSEGVAIAVGLVTVVYVAVAALVLQRRTGVVSYFRG